MKEQWENINIDEIEPMEVTDMEKARVKQHITKQQPKKKMGAFAKVSAAAVIFVSGLTAAGVASPALAERIPFMQNVVAFITSPLDAAKSENATALLQVSEDKGIKVMVDRAIFDGTTLTIYYAVESKEDLGDYPSFSGQPMIKGAEGSTGRNSLEKINDTTYIGVTTATPHGKQFDAVDVTWDLTMLTKGNKQEISGDWSFAFTLDAEQATTLPLQYSTQEEGVSLHLTELRQTPSVTTLYYSTAMAEELKDTYRNVTVLFTNITDDLGNVYEIEDNGASSDDEGITLLASSTLNALDKNATTLTLTPIALYAGPESGPLAKEHEMEPITIQLK
ncbi:DUF4179 domain-containing protein [Metalysinibacillus jejuensis]|uniref:DUF4179 domain-containing protein n=1 Tax=Metalysinibacillus jejuensis TaxID=914327 RepID=UPI0013794268|nr:DUF4179 domain-containing protein [Metalysinibacillus jejuensis]